MGPHFVVCADDYGISDATSDTIRALLADGRINATSCLVEHPDWHRFAAPLRRLAEQDRRVAVGLHLNLTARFDGIGDPGIVRPILRHVAFARFVTDAAVARIYRTFARQWDLFAEAVGRPPDFVDGHEHVHLLPAPTEALLRLAEERHFRGWLRQCRSSARPATFKARLLSYLSDGFIQRAVCAGVPINPGFGGLRRFRPSEAVETIWQRDIAAMRFGGVLIVHPGGGGSPRGMDGIDPFREREAALLQSGVLSQWLHRSPDQHLRWPGAQAPLMPAPFVRD